jgi:hypothetical protein
MKKTDIKYGDRVLVNPHLSIVPSHWGTFHHMHRGGFLMYEPDKNTFAYNRSRKIQGCCWKEILQIIKF